MTTKYSFDRSLKKKRSVWFYIGRPVVKAASASINWQIGRVSRTDEI
jgi:hypothetical protein